MMIAAVIGSRGFNSYLRLQEELDKMGRFSRIISGGASGADSLAAAYARRNGISLVELKPDYATHGKSAPFVRNRQIVDDSDVVIAFWDGESRGTKYTLDYARSKNKTIVIIGV